MIIYRAYLEQNQNGQVIAHVLSVPGCFGSGVSETAALTAVTQTLQTMCNESGEIEVVVAERMGKEPLFTPER
ncbi:MAG: hypothetical protein GY796_19675, partial [Chloroflexi bacterium]|nr:hypothetical protein [Chloroflexota bacterium]